MKTLNPIFLSILMLVASATQAQVPQLSSYPSARATIYLDFDGEYVTGSSWNWSGPINAAAPVLTSENITEIFNRVAEDFRIFNVNISTNLSDFNAAPVDQRMRVIVTPSSAWYGNAGGVSYVGSFIWGDDTPAWVFADKLQNNVKYIAEACSHEAGHTLGLQHQSRYDANCSKVAEYAAGQGSGEIGWAPIMGVGYYKNLTTWFNGPNSRGCNNLQNDIEIIAGPENNFGLRPDDFSDSYINAAPVLKNGSDFTIEGLINSSIDKDVFRLTLNGSNNLKLTAIPKNVGAGNSGADVDIRVSLLNSIGDTIGRYNPSDLLNAGADTNLVAGTYYLVAEGVGNLNHDDYGSVGYYSIAGSLNQPLPIHDLHLRATDNGNVHALSWTYTSDEPIKEFQVEWSANGSSFKYLATVDPSNRGISLQAEVPDRAYYRIKALTKKDETAYYSNIATIGAGQKISPVIIQKSAGQNTIIVNSTGVYDYALMNLNGQMLTKGKLSLGMNLIELRTQTKGLLLLRMTDGSTQFTEKIIKQ